MRPSLPLEVIPGVPWPPGFREDFEAWAKDFFSEEPPKPRKRRLGKQTLASILHSLDATFANLKRDIEDTDKFLLPTLSKADRVGLTRIGPLVVERLFADDWQDKELPFSKNNKALPSHVFVSCNNGGLRNGELLHADFGFAIKLKKVPWYVAKQSGQAWMFGLAWRTDAGKLIWATFYAYTKDGKVLPSFWLCNQSVPLPRGSYTRKVWQVSSWKDHNEEPDGAARSILSNLLSVYTERGENWTVSVKKGDMRAKFLIAGNDTAEAFADRSATALAADGRRKRIIHFVREHTQNHGGKIVVIPAHIRGIRSFNWNGYECNVTAPQFHTFSDVGFTVESEEFNDDSMPDNMIDLPALANKLVAMEDEHNTRKPKQRKRQ